MMKRAVLILFIVSLFSPSLAWAGVGPFGLALGTTTLAETRALLGTQTSLAEAGRNQWTAGPMLEANGAGLGLDGLRSVLLIFDQREALVGVILELEKHRYSEIKRLLGEQYPLISQQAPFVGDQRSIFRKDGVTITAESRHLGFIMEVLYSHPILEDARTSGLAREQAEREQRERSRL